MRFPSAVQGSSASAVAEAVGDDGVAIDQRARVEFEPPDLLSQFTLGGGRQVGSPS